MFRSLSTAATGMEAQQTRLDVTANNIANVSTPGFKRSRPEFQDLIYQVERMPGANTSETTQTPTGLQVGMGVRTTGTDRSFSQGDMKQTGNALDVAIEGSGFLMIQMPGGETTYTRNGALKLDAQGRIVNPDGFPLVGDLSVPADTLSISIGGDGLVTATVAGDTNPVEVGQIQLANFANPAGLLPTGHNLYRSTVASGEAIVGNPGENGTGSLAQGIIEMSNVKVVEEMVDLISGQRAYEINAKVIRAADEMLNEAANLR